MLEDVQDWKLTAAQRAVLAAVVDTFVPSIEVADDPHGFFARSGSDTGTDQRVAAFLSATTPAAGLRGLAALFDELDNAGFPGKPLGDREAALRELAGSGPEAASAVGGLRQCSLLLAYGATDEAGHNPFWTAIGYPGALSEPPRDVPKTLTVTTPADVTEADVVVVGSGSGGSVVAAELAAAGRRVVVLEVGGYFTEADFVQLELAAYQNLFSHGGIFTTADGNVVVAAGGAVGGGSLVNWSNCVRTPHAVRARWASEFGLDGLDGPEFDAHLDAVATRLGINEDAAVPNRPHERLFAGADSLGYHHRRALNNVDAHRQDPAVIAYSGFGDQSGAKQSTLKTYLQDACDAGATIFARTSAERVLLAMGRAAGVEAVHTDPETGTRRTVRITAPQVVLAAGALETPALLLRSGIGGAAVGHHLHIHPVGMVSGLYAEPMDPWYGPAQAGIVDEFAGREQGHGFLLEGSHHYLGLLSTSIPWVSGLADKQLLLRTRYRADFVCLVQDRGAGRVTTDDDGRAVAYYPLDDELDRRNYHDALAAAARIHAAAGAEVVYAGYQPIPPWRRGAERLEDFLARLRKCPIGRSGLSVFTAHLMGSARLGTDAASSVAAPSGEVHDVPGLWIGDAGAFPTAAGVNPMWTCMALARRTAHNLLAAGS